MARSVKCLFLFISVFIVGVIGPPPHSDDKRNETEDVVRLKGNPKDFPVYKVKGNCLRWMFKCSNMVCIPLWWTCDGVDDCGDNSDEHDCDKPSTVSTSTATTCTNNQSQCDTDNQDCKPNQFKCNNGRCILKLQQCNLKDDCGDGSDEVNCTQRIPTICRPGEFQCGDSLCIPNMCHCNGEANCNDGSDEKNCTIPICEPGKFRCANNRCIYYASWKCDGYDDCGDNSDEENCPKITSTTPAPDSRCQSWAFECSNKVCIPVWWRCNGVDDCRDNSDEEGCEPISTTACALTAPIRANNQFQCDAGECILDTKLCDGKNDCTNGEDERNCTLCQEDEFMCRKDKLCIPIKKLCDQVNDCPDGSDEEESCIPAATHVPDS